MTKSLTKFTKLSNGVEMPTVGFGTWQIPLNENFKSTIQTAIQLGYRHFDTAQIYNNSVLMGEAIRESGIPRSEFFITSKVWASHCSYESAKEAFEQVRTQLQLDYLDLLLIHWPASQGEPMVWQAQNAGTWRAFEELYKDGLVRAIGVANFLPHHLVPLLARAKITPMVNQLECHPGYTQAAAVRFSEERGMRVLILKPAIDTKGQDSIISRLGISCKVDQLVTPEMDVVELVRANEAAHGKIACVLCDESQFFTPEQADQLFLVTVDLGIPVICYGLRADFMMRGFPGSTRLLEIAHTIEELKTICACGRKAICNGRKVNGEFVFEGAQVAIDTVDDVEYQSLCPQCWYREYRAFLARHPKK